MAKRKIVILDLALNMVLNHKDFFRERQLLVKV